MSYVQLKSHAEVLGIRVPMYEIQGDKIQPTTPSTPLLSPEVVLFTQVTWVPILALPFLS